MAETKLKPGALVERFASFYEREAYYVDKTLFIQEILENPNQVILYTRPRRFGKTLNLSTLQTFLEYAYDIKGNVVDPRPYFEGKKIMACGDKILSHMGKYPVIFLTLKDCGQPTFTSSIAQFQQIISSIFRKYEIPLREKLTSAYDLELLTELCREACEDKLKRSLQKLTEWIVLVTGSKPYILIDEYDVPLQYAYHYGYYDQMVSFIRALFSCGLKTNDQYFEKAVLTGCLRISKESIFTGFNNLDVNSISTANDEEFMGFTPDEVREMLDYYDLSGHYDAIQAWYDSYVFGQNHVYNPFSLVQCVRNLTRNDPDAIRCYWTNSSSNDIIRDIVIEHPECCDDLQQLMHGEPIFKPIHESMTYRDMDAYDENIWTLLYFTGYVKSLSHKQVGARSIHEIVLVNEEIKAIFPQFIDILFYKKVKQHDLSAFYQAIWDKNADEIKKVIDDILFGMISYYDTQEMFYHGMMLGILSHLYQYKIESNREEGNGRTDIVLRDMRNDRAVIFEFKWTDKKSRLKGLSAGAIEQVRRNKYAEALHHEGYQTVYAVGIGFCAKTCEVVIEEL